MRGNWVWNHLHALSESPERRFQLVQDDIGSVLVFTGDKHLKSSLHVFTVIQRDPHCFWFCLLVLPGVNPIWRDKALEVLVLLKELVIFQ